jgi:hypothetical protein
VQPALKILLYKNVAFIFAFAPLLGAWGSLFQISNPGYTDITGMNPDAHTSASFSSVHVVSAPNLTVLLIPGTSVMQD